MVTNFAKLLIVIGGRTGCLMARLSRGQAHISQSLYSNFRKVAFLAQTDTLLMKPKECILLSSRN